MSFRPSDAEIADAVTTYNAAVEVFTSLDHATDPAAWNQAHTALSDAEDTIFMVVARRFRTDMKLKAKLRRSDYWGETISQLVSYAEAMAAGTPTEWITAFND